MAGSPRPVRVFLVDDHEVVRRGVAELLEDDPGLAAVGDFVTARARPAVLLCCELTSLHVQPAQRDLDQVVAHALFSDAAAHHLVVVDQEHPDGPTGGHRQPPLRP